MAAAWSAPGEPSVPDEGGPNGRGRALRGGERTGHDQHGHRAEVDDEVGDATEQCLHPALTARPENDEIGSVLFSKSGELVAIAAEGPLYQRFGLPAGGAGQGDTGTREALGLGAALLFEQLDELLEVRGLPGKALSQLGGGERWFPQVQDRRRG